MHTNLNNYIFFLKYLGSVPFPLHCVRSQPNLTNCFSPTSKDDLLMDCGEESFGIWYFHNYQIIVKQHWTVQNEVFSNKLQFFMDIWNVRLLFSRTIYITIFQIWMNFILEFSSWMLSMTKLNWKDLSFQRHFNNISIWIEWSRILERNEKSGLSLRCAGFLTHVLLVLLW